MNDEDIYHQFIVLFKRIFSVSDFDAGALYISEDSDGESYAMIYSIGFPQEYQERVRKIFRGQGFSGVATELKSIRISDDVRGNTRFFRRVLQSAGYRSMVSIPLLSNGRVMGIINFANHDAIKVDTGKRAQLSVVGEVLGNCIDGCLRAKASERHEQLSKQLHLLGIDIFWTNDLTRICTTTLEESRVLLDYSCAMIAIIKPVQSIYSQGLTFPNTRLDPGLLNHLYACWKKLKYVIDRDDPGPSELLDFLDKNDIDQICFVNLGTGDSPMGILAFGLKGRKFDAFGTVACRQIGRSLTLAINKFLQSIREGTRDTSRVQQNFMGIA
jgi:hypothetical protein